MRPAECRRRPTKINTEQAYRLSLERRVHVKIERIFHLKLKTRNDNDGYLIIITGFTHDKIQYVYQSKS